MLPQFVLAPLAALFVISEPPRQVAAIIILLGGESPARVLKAAEIYKLGYAPKIIFGSGYVDTTFLEQSPDGFKWPGAGERYALSLESLHVPKDAISIIDSSDDFDTSSELTAIAQFAKLRGMNQVILITSALHTKRVKLIWERVGNGINGIVIAAEEPGLTQWWKNGRLISQSAYETGAFIKEYLRRILLIVKATN